MPRVLIVAYGNPLRCDDGIAWRAADALAERFTKAQLEIVRVHQLAPELADAVRNRELVLFVDAACVDDLNNNRPGEILISKLSNDQIQKYPPGQFSHVYSPAKVLGLARELYRADPKAFVITIAGENFGHGDCLSTPVANSLPELIGTITHLVNDTVAGPKSTRDENPSSELS